MWGRLAAAGVIVVVACLTGFAIWVALSTRGAAASVRSATILGDAYEHARFDVAQEESFERKYRLEPNAAVRQAHTAAEAALLNELRLIGRFGEPADRATVRRLLLLHERYLRGVNALFTAVDDGDANLVWLSDLQTEPVFDLLTELVNASAARHRKQALASVGELKRTGTIVTAGTAGVFSVGLALLLTFTSILAYHRRRREQSLEQELRTAEGKFQTLVEQMPLATYVNSIGREAEVVYASPQIEALLGVTPDEWVRRPDLLAECVHPDDRAVLAARARAVAAPEPFHGEYRLRRNDGSTVSVLDEMIVVRGDHGEPLFLQGFLLDLTESRSLEEQLRQSQKMEAVGSLAGGIAHDFNNLMTAIIGYSELVDSQGTDPATAERVGEIRKAAERASSLTQQLLAFSRKQVLKPRVLNPNTVVGEMNTMLRQLLGEDVEIVEELDAELGNVVVDPARLEQVIVNLAVNARDAMPVGGVLTIRTSNVEVEADNAVDGEVVVHGSYVAISVADTGCGIAPELQSRIFEPFFTTKDPGKGSGLGLATVYGTAKQSGGYVTVESSPGAGSTFTAFIPRVTADVSPIVQPKAVVPRRGSERILYVEDEAIVRNVTAEALLLEGYDLVVAHDPEHALALAEQEAPFALLITDIVMPKLNGRQLAEKLHERWDDLCVLYVSGYDRETITQRGLLEPDTMLLQKPFSLAELRVVVREILDGITPQHPVAVAV
jgi:PAS domain S-box-containing protein